jgi:pimeloyl-ACP methyl ester carboxylesterase
VARLSLLALILAASCVATVSASPATSQDAIYCAGRGDVRFRAADGTRLLGHRFGRGTTAVVLAHQSQGSLCEWLSYGRRLAAKGYLAFAFDFRSHGRSQLVFPPRSGRLGGDVAAAVRYLRARGARKVFLVGASMGGVAVVVGGASIRPPVAGVVSLSAPTTFGSVDAGAAAPGLRVPTLFLAAADDAGGRFATDARALHAATAASEKSLEILPGSSHGVSLMLSAGRARQLVETFLASH